MSLLSKKEPSSLIPSHAQAHQAATTCCSGTHKQYTPVTNRYQPTRYLELQQPVAVGLTSNTHPLPTVTNQPDTSNCNKLLQRSSKTAVAIGGPLKLGSGGSGKGYTSSSPFLPLPPSRSSRSSLPPSLPPLPFLSLRVSIQSP